MPYLSMIRIDRELRKHVQSTPLQRSCSVPNVSSFQPSSASSSTIGHCVVANHVSLGWARAQLSITRNAAAFANLELAQATHDEPCAGYRYPKPRLRMPYDINSVRYLEYSACTGFKTPIHYLYSANFRFTLVRTEYYYLIIWNQCRDTPRQSD